MTLSCNRQNSKIYNKDKVVVKSISFVDTSKSIRSNIYSKKDYYFYNDSFVVLLRECKTTPNQILFQVKKHENEFVGIAKLELIDDNGVYYLPESTPRLDETDNKEYFCDSTFSYQSDKISFVFAMENKNHQRLSFIINNSSVLSFKDSIYTLYRR